jgi:hypothetical protein
MGMNLKLDDVFIVEYNAGGVGGTTEYRLADFENDWHHFLTVNVLGEDVREIIEERNELKLLKEQLEEFLVELYDDPLDTEEGKYDYVFQVQAWVERHQAWREWCTYPVDIDNLLQAVELVKMLRENKPEEKYKLVLVEIRRKEAVLG